MITSPEDLGYVLIEDSKDYYINNRGEIASKYANGNLTPITPASNANGYLKVNFFDYKGERISKTVHFLVAQAFIGPPQPGMWVKHKNGIKTDNRVENLEYVMKVSGVPKTCLNCQGVFRTTVLGKEYCSFKCQAEYEGIIFNCKHCDSKYTPQTKGSSYCGLDCKTSAESGPTSYHASRFVIFKRDNFTCVYCGGSPMNKQTDLHLDHVFPRSKGGENDLYNLVTSCSKCNLEKSDKLLSEEKILEIWTRNRLLNEKYQISEYDELKERFDKIWKTMQPCGN